MSILWWLLMCLECPKFCNCDCCNKPVDKCDFCRYSDYFDFNR